MKRVLFLALALCAPFIAQATDLRADTASTIVVGPIVNSSGVAQTAEAITQADVQLWKEGGTVFAQKNESTSCTHRLDGFYTCPINATDTDTEGVLVIQVAEGSNLIWRGNYRVVAADFYDATYVDGDLINNFDVGVLREDTIATVTSQTEYDLTTTIVTDDNWLNLIITIQDVSSGEVVTRYVTDVDQANDRVTINTAPPFTVAVNDVVRIKDSVHPVAASTSYGAATSTQLTNSENSIEDTVVGVGQLLARSDAAIKADRSSLLALINNDEGTGAGDYDNETDSLEVAPTTTRDAIMRYTLETGIEFEEFACHAMAILLGESDYTSGTGTAVFQDPNGTNNRVTVVYGTDNGDRTTITLNVANCGSN